MRKLHTLSSLALGLLTAATLVHAQGNSPAQNDPWHAKYQADLAQCAQLPTPEAVANCRRDAGAAYETARKGELNSGPSDQLRQNAIQRCNNLPAAQREDCMINMQQGANTQIQGSVTGGGILRRTEIVIPGDPAPTAPPPPNIITPQTADPALGDLPRASSVQQ